MEHYEFEVLGYAPASGWWEFNDLSSTDSRFIYLFYIEAML